MRRNKFICHNIIGLKMIYKLFPQSITLYAIFQMLHGASWVFQVISMQYFFDGITECNQPIQLVIRILLLGGAYTFAQIMNGVTNCYGQILNLRVTKETKKSVFRTINRKDAIAFEHAEELDKINKAVLGAEGVFWVSTTLLDIVFFYAFYFLMMSWYLFSMTPILGLSIVIIFIPNVISRFLQMVSFERFEAEVAPVRRKTEYYAGCITGKEYYKETRLWGCGNTFFAIYRSLLIKGNQLLMQLQLQKEKINLYINILTVLAYGIIIIMLVYCVLEGTVSVGAFAAVFAALREFYGFMNEIISERLTISFENMAMVKNYFTFVGEEKAETEKIELPEHFDIRLDQVSFAYPHAEAQEPHWVLSDIHLQIPWGQTIALVGENGSGKSTLCHILTGLYPPTKGRVFYGEEQIGKGRIVSGISAVFQKFCRYQMSLSENIRISDMQGDKHKDSLQQICRETGVEIGRVGGMDGMLGREFGGTELSGGQWQRIAIARGVYRKHPLMILDEPTAAIDALEEKNLYEEFRKLAKNGTFVIVTHRLASAQIADRILVMKKGRIVQDGSHSELLAVAGEYKNMYELQRQWYL